MLTCAPPVPHRPATAAPCTANGAAVDDLTSHGLSAPADDEPLAGQVGGESIRADARSRCRSDVAGGESTSAAVAFEVRVDLPRAVLMVVTHGRTIG